MAGPMLPKSEPLLGQRVEAERLQTDDGGEVDVGIEIAARDIDALGGGFGAQAGGDDVRPAADQVGLKIGREAEGLQRRRLRGVRA